MKKILLTSVALYIVTHIISIAHAETLYIYSQRQSQLIKPILAQFTKKTNINIEIIDIGNALAQRLKAESKNTQADVILTNGSKILYDLSRDNLLAPINDKEILNNIPNNFRAQKNDWLALTMRARIIVTSKNRVGADNIKNYEDLADKQWQGRLCTRKGSHSYNRGLMASMIVHHGEDYALNWAKGLVANMARKPQGNDRAQAKAIYQGQCDIAIMNSYYFGLMLHGDKKTEQQNWAKSLDIIFPNQDNRGTHVNITGGAVSKYSKNKENALKLLRFLSSIKGQELYSSLNYEYPVNPKATLSPIPASWGKFKADKAMIEQIEQTSRQAQILIDQAKW